MGRGPSGAEGEPNVGFHRYINFSIGIDKAPSGGKAGGEREQPPTKEEKRTVLAKAKKKIEGMNLDGYVVTEIADDLPPGIAKNLGRR
jgi:hypothetical protein